MKKIIALIMLIICCFLLFACQGAQGENGDPGVNGQPPYIGENGNWWVGDTDLGVSAQGPQGEKGDKGEKGDPGESGNTTYEGTDGLDFYPLPDGTYGVMAGKTIYLEEIIIPSRHNGKNVTQILDGAFKESTNLVSITIPESVITINHNAFYGCYSLTSVMFEENSRLTTIGFSSFEQCTSLENIEIPASVVTINSYAFYKCRALKSVTFKNDSQCTTIESHAFLLCDNLNYNEHSNAYYLGTETNPYLACVRPKSRNIIDCEINSNTKIICDGAFSNCTFISTIKIPASVTTIGSNAFYSCTNLTSVIFAEESQCTYIKSSTFDSCNKLNYNEYSNAYYLGTETNPYFICIVSKNKNIVNCEIHSDTKIIGGYSFGYCSSLESIEIPANIKLIDQHTFDGCTDLENVTFEGTIEQWNAIVKGFRWNTNMLATEVVCSDGTVPLK